MEGRFCDQITSLNEAVDEYVARGRVANSIPRKRKATEKLNAMSKDELVEFVKFLYSPSDGRNDRKRIAQ